MTIEEYIKDCWNKGREYIEGVSNGDIKANKWIKLAIKQHMKDIKRDDIVYDIDKIEKVFKFFYFLNISPIERFKLLPYQVYIIIALFGFYWKDSGLRKYRYAFVFVGRKNGKTTFVAALQLYAMVVENEPSPQSILVASTKPQASIALNAASELITHSPMLKKRLEFYGPQDSRHRIVFADKTKSGFCKTFSAFAERLDGLNPSFSILDEIHVMRDYSLFNVIKSGIGARKNPLIFLISTAGFLMDGMCNDIVKSGKEQLEGTKERDESFLYLLYTLDDGDDPYDEEVWIKANPSLGNIISIEYLRGEMAQAKLLPKQKANFYTKHLNLFAEEPDTWMPNVLVSKQSQNLKLEDFEGLDCYVGTDFSKNRDFTSVSLTFKKDGNFYSFTFLFFAKNADNIVEWNGREYIRQWIKEGHIIECKTETMDYKMIEDYIMSWSSLFNIVQLNYDPAYSREIIPNLTKQGVYCVPFRQGAMNFTGPIREVELHMLEGDMILQKNPVMQWHFANVVYNENKWGNASLTKNYKLDPIDGVISLIMSFGSYLESTKVGDYDMSYLNGDK